MELNESEKTTIKCALVLYANTINFCLKNRKARRSNKDVARMMDTYETDLKNIEDIIFYLR